MSPLYKNLKRKYATAPFVREKRADKTLQRILIANKALILTVIVLGVLYLGQINALATKGYAIRELEKQMTELQKEHTNLEYQIASESSLEAVQGRIDGLHLVRSDHIDYFTSDHGVAVAR